MKYLRIFWSKQRVFFCFPELSVTLIALTVTHCLPMYKIRKLKCHLRTCRSSYRKEEKFLHPVCKWTSILIGVRCITSLLHGQQSYHSYYRDFFSIKSSTWRNGSTKDVCGYSEITYLCCLEGMWIWNFFLRLYLSYFFGMKKCDEKVSYRSTFFYHYAASFERSRNNTAVDHRFLSRTQLQILERKKLERTIKISIIFLGWF